NSGTGALTGGAYEVFAGSTFRFNSANIVTNAATILLDGVTSQITNQSSANGLANFATNAAAGHFTIQNGRNFTAPGAFSNAGSVTIGASSQFIIPGGGSFTQTGGTTNLQGGNLTELTPPAGSAALFNEFAD